MEAKISKEQLKILLDLLELVDANGDLLTNTSHRSESNFYQEALDLTKQYFKYAEQTAVTTEEENVQP